MLRKHVLQSFKALHKTRKVIFGGDLVAQEKARLKINEEYKRNIVVADEVKIEQLVKLAKDVEKELRTTVIQAIETEPGKFEATIMPDTLKLENVPFKDICHTKVSRRK